MVSLQSVNVAIRINPLYRTAARHIQTFVLWIAERGNWLSVRVADAGVRTRNTAGSIMDELSRMVQRANHMNGRRKPEPLLKFLFPDPSWCNWVRCWAYIISPISSPYSRG